MLQVIKTLLDRVNPIILPFSYISVDQPSIFIGQLDN